MRRDQRRSQSLNKNIYYLIGGTILLFVIVFVAVYFIFGSNNSKKSDVIDTERFGQTRK